MTCTGSCGMDDCGTCGNPACGDCGEKICPECLRHYCEVPCACGRAHTCLCWCEMYERRGWLSQVDEVGSPRH